MGKLFYFFHSISNPHLNRQDQELQIQVLQRCVKEFHADLQARNDLGETVLHTAALRASPRVVQCLIDLSSDINDVNM